MAVKGTLKDPTTNESLYPVTFYDQVRSADGTTRLDQDLEQISSELTNNIVFEKKQITTTGAISANVQFEYNAKTNFPKSGYEMILAIGICYSGGVVCSNYSPTIVSYCNRKSYDISNLTFEVLCVYKKS